MKPQFFTEGLQVNDPGKKKVLASIRKVAIATEGKSQFLLLQKDTHYTLPSSIQYVDENSSTTLSK